MVAVVPGGHLGSTASIMPDQLLKRARRGPAGVIEAALKTAARDASVGLRFADIGLTIEGIRVEPESALRSTLRNNALKHLRQPPALEIPDGLYGMVRIAAREARYRRFAIRMDPVADWIRA